MAPNAAHVFHLSILWALEDGHFPEEEEESDEEVLLFGNGDNSSSEEESSSDDEGGEAAAFPPGEEGGGPLFLDMPIVDVVPVLDGGNPNGGQEVNDGGSEDAEPAEAGPASHTDALAPPFCADLAHFLSGADLTPTSAYLYALSAPLVPVVLDVELSAGEVTDGGDDEIEE